MLPYLQAPILYIYIYDAPHVFLKDLELQREAHRLEEEACKVATKTEAEWRRDGDYSSTELLKKKSLVTF